MQRQMTILRSFATVALTLLLLAGEGRAVDGEILINQAAVNAGGITPGDDPGFPTTLSRPGRYKLTSNLKVPTGKDGIELKAHDVTIDLNGFTISSNPPGEAKHGVFASGILGLRVMNGTVTGFQDGGLFGPRLVEDMRIVSNGFGLGPSGEARIRNNTIANNRGPGIHGCSHCLIEQNLITGNNWGIFVSHGGGVILGNVIASHLNEGISAFPGPPTGYGNNVLVDNSGGDAPVTGPAFPLHPNLCHPACP
jgi:hypothetical protein